MDVADVESELGKDLLKHVVVEREGNHVAIKKKDRWIPKDVWGDINTLVKTKFDGWWATENENSRWLIAMMAEDAEPVEKAKPVGKLTQTQLVEEAMSLLEQSMATSEKAWQKLKEVYKKA